MNLDLLNMLASLQQQAQPNDQAQAFSQMQALLQQ
jgi:hypothetical protein